MENDPFIDDFPIKTFIFTGFSMAMLNNQMVICINREISIHGDESMKMDLGKFHHDLTAFFRNPYMMVNVRGIIPLYGRTIQVSELI